MFEYKYIFIFSKKGATGFVQQTKEQEIFYSQVPSEYYTGSEKRIVQCIELHGKYHQRKVKSSLLSPSRSRR